MTLTLEYTTFIHYYRVLLKVAFEALFNTALTPTRRQKPTLKPQQAAGMRECNR